MGSGEKRLCPYCLGSFSGRSDAVVCSTADRVAMHAALKRASWADVASAVWRRDSYSDERRHATGIGTMSAVEGYHADLRIRVLVGNEPIEHVNQWEAVNELPFAEIERRLGLDREAWDALRARLLEERERVRRDIREVTSG